MMLLDTSICTPLIPVSRSWSRAEQLDGHDRASPSHDS